MIQPRSRHFGFAVGLGVLAMVGCRSVRPVENPLPTYDPAPWAEVLDGVVRDGLVDYFRLREFHEPALDQYLDAVARFGPQTTPELFPAWCMWLMATSG